MKNHLLIFFLVLSFSCTVSKPHKKNTSETVVLGTIHFPTKKVNADSIYTILNDFKPDIILLEADSSNFYPDFTFRHLYDENEYIAVVRYKMKKPGTQIRPIEFEGRNTYRKTIGIFSEPGDAFQKAMNNLITQKQFTAYQQDLLDRLIRFERLAQNLKSESLRLINNPQSDNIIDSLNHYKYKGLKEIVSNHPVFHETKMIDSKKDTTTVRDNFILWSDFEGNMRNQAIASNALNIINQNPGKRIIVLTGFFHRSYVLNKLKENNIKVREYYQ